MHNLCVVTPDITGHGRRQEELDVCELLNKLSQKSHPVHQSSSKDKITENQRIMTNV